MTCTTTCRTPRGRQAHCGACHRTFGAITGFDRHRRNFACLDPATIGLHTDSRGIWRTDRAVPPPDAPARTSV